MEVIKTEHILTPLGKLVLFGIILIIGIILFIICYVVSSTEEDTKVSVEETVVSREVLEETEESKNQVTGIKTITTEEATEENEDDDTTVSIDEIEISTSTSRVGNTYTLSQSTGLYENEDLTGNYVTYKAGTKLLVIEEISDTVDYVQSVKTGKYGYVDNTKYK